jgi:GAF domain-containing protein
MSARARARLLVRRTEALAEIADALGVEETFREKLWRVAGIFVPTFADVVLVDVVRGSRVERVAVVVADLSRLDFFRQIYGRSPAPDSIVFEVLRDAMTRTVGRVGDDERRRMIEQPDRVMLDILHRFGPRSCISIPAIAANQCWGAFTFVYSTPGRRYTKSDVPVLESFIAAASYPLRAMQSHDSVPPRRRSDVAPRGSRPPATGKFAKIRS